MIDHQMRVTYPGVNLSTILAQPVLYGSVDFSRFIHSTLIVPTIQKVMLELPIASVMVAIIGARIGYGRANDDEA